MSGSVNHPGRPPKPLSTAVAGYASARVGLVAAVTAGLVLVGVPLWVALLVALVASMPLSMLLFPGLRGDLNEALATTGARRAAQKERLRAQLRGDDRPEPGEAPAP